MPRIIYSLFFELCPRKTSEAVEQLELIVPLDAEGQSPHCCAEPPKTRVIDLRPGDWVRHRTGRYRIRAIRTYRDGQIKAETVADAVDGYVVRGS